jgi:hypothetical protein
MSLSPDTAEVEPDHPVELLAFSGLTRVTVHASITSGLMVEFVKPTVIHGNHTSIAGPADIKVETQGDWYVSQRVVFPPWESGWIVQDTRVQHLPFVSVRNEHRDEGAGDGSELLKMGFYKRSADPHGLKSSFRRSSTGSLTTFLTFLSVHL